MSGFIGDISALGSIALATNATSGSTITSLGGQGMSGVDLTTALHS